MSLLPLEDHWPWSVEDLDALPDTHKYEIVDGRLLVSPRPLTRHARTLRMVMRAIEAALPEGYVCVSDIMVKLPTSSRVPDAIVVLDADLIEPRSTLPAGAFTLAVEVESPSSVGEDRIRKPAEYAAAGIPAYWHVSQHEEPQITTYILEPEAQAYRLDSSPTGWTRLPYAIDLTT